MFSPCSNPVLFLFFKSVFSRDFLPVHFLFFSCFLPVLFLFSPIFPYFFSFFFPSSVPVTVILSSLPVSACLFPAIFLLSLSQCSFCSHNIFSFSPCYLYLFFSLSLFLLFSPSVLLLSSPCLVFLHLPPAIQGLHCVWRVW